MNTKLTFEWFYAAGMRALKTFAQTALSMITVGQAIGDIKWTYVCSVSAVAGLYSLLTSLATKLPEVGSDGILQIDKSDPEKDTYRLMLSNALEDLGEKKKVTLSVDANASLSSQK